MVQRARDFIDRYHKPTPELQNAANEIRRITWNAAPAVARGAFYAAYHKGAHGRLFTTAAVAEIRKDPYYHQRFDFTFRISIWRSLEVQEV